MQRPARPWIWRDDRKAAYGTGAAKRLRHRGAMAQRASTHGSQRGPDRAERGRQASSCENPAEPNGGGSPRRYRHRERLHGAAAVWLLVRSARIACRAGRVGPLCSAAQRRRDTSRGAESDVGGGSATMGDRWDPHAATRPRGDRGRGRQRRKIGEPRRVVRSELGLPGSSRDRRVGGSRPRSTFCALRTLLRRILVLPCRPGG